MGLVEKVYSAPGGQYSITDPVLSYTDVLKVKREGMGYDIVITGSPGNRQVLYETMAGKITFLNPFIEGGPGFPSDVQEKVYVLYKTT